MRATHRSGLKPLGLALCLALAYPLAHALPQGAQVVQGQAKVSTPQAGQGLIQQGSDKAVINWQSFSIGASESLRIEQPGVNSVLLNRVVGGDPSLVLGRMQSNGQVFLINPRGIVFGRGSQVDAGSFVASTLDLSDSAFLAGSYRFTAGVGAGGLQADGSIAAPGGTVALVAPQLNVGGTVQAHRVGLAAASSVTVDVEGDGLVLFNLRNDDDRDVALKFGGHIQADGGSAELRAQARGGAAGQVLNMDGLVQARGLRQQGGRIVIDGGTAGDTTVNGSLDATGETGGGITVLGQRVALLDAARLDASGRLGGGSLQVGGGFHGEGTDHNAERTWVAGGAQLRADATSQGDGGRVAIWADLRTDMMGQVSARGGALGGNGGSVETSGKQQLNMPSGGVDLGAPRGRAGNWLLDPNDLTIAGSGLDTNVAPSAPFVTTGNNAVLTVATLNPALTGGATVIVRTASASGGGPPGTGSIDVQGTILPAGAATLNLIAQGNITFSTGKIAAGPGALNVNLLAGSDASGGNPGGQASTITATGAGTIIDTNGGALAVTAKDGIAFSGVKSATLTITSTNTVTGGAVVLPTGTVSGNLQASTSGVINQASGGLVVTGTSTLSAGSAAITLTDAANNLQGAVSLTGGATQIKNTKNASNALTLGTLSTGALTVTAGGGALTLGTGTVTGALSATSGGGAITQAAGGLVVTGTSSLSAGSAAITLTDTANNLQGAVSLTGGTTQVSNGTGNALTLGTLNTADLTATVGGGTLTLGTGTVTGALSATSGGGAITQAAGGLVVTGTSTLNAASAAITLTDTANNLQGAVNLTGGVTQIKNTKNASNALTLGTLSTADLTATAGGGALTLGTGTVTGALNATSGGGAITQAAGGLVVTGASTLNAASAAITLTDAANDLQGAVSLTGGVTQIKNTKNASNALTLGTLSTTDLTATAGGGTLTLGTGTVTGALSATSGGGAITQAAGGLVVTGTSSLSAGSAAITLTDTANNLQGAVNLTGGAAQIRNTKNASNALTLGTLSTADLTATAGGGTLTLGTGAVTGALSATSGGGAITQAAGGLVVTGASTLNATSAAITLTDAANDLQGAVSLTGGVTQIKNTKNASNALTLGTLSTADLTATAGGGALTLGTGTVTGALNATSGGGAITQAAGGLVVTGASTLNAASAAITLTDAANDLQGAVSLTGGTTQVSNGTGRALTLGTLSTGALTATAGGGTLTLGTGTVTGALSATSGGGAITQAAGGLVVTGVATLNATGAAITLTDSANDLQGTVNLTGGVTQIRNTKNASNALTLGTLSTADLTATAGGGTLTLGTGTVTGALSATSGGGAITQAAGGLVVTGASSLNATSAAITLTDAANDLQGAVNLTGGVTQIKNTKNASNALTLGTLSTADLTATAGGGTLTLGTGTVTGALNATSGGGAIGQTAGGLVVTGNASVNAGSAAITLSDSHNDWQGSVALTGGATTIVSTASAASTLTLGALNTGSLSASTSGGNLTLGTGTVAGTLNASSGGGTLSQVAGGITVSGVATLNATLAGDVSLTDTHNHWNGGVQLTGNSLDLRSAGDLSILALSQPANRALTLESDGNLSLGAVDLNTGIADLSLTSLGGSFTAGGKLAGHNIALVAQTGLNLGHDITAGGTLSLGTTGGGINQTAGAILVTGTTTVAAGSSAIGLGQAGNHFGGAVQLTGGSSQIVDSAALTLGTLSTGNLMATSTGTLNLGQGSVAGTLTATSNGGNVVQSGALTLTGAASLNAGGAAITLTQPANDLQGAIAATGGAISLHTAHNLVLSALSQAPNQALDLEAAGTLTLPAGTVNIDTGSAALTLVAQGGAVNAPGTLSGSDITLRGQSVLLAHDVTASGNLVVQGTAGTVNQTAGRLAVVGSSQFDAGAQALALGGALNDFQGAVSLTGGATQIAATSLHALNLASLATGSLTASSGNALRLGTGTVGGMLSATSAGAMTQAAGGITVAGNASLNAGSAAITLLDAANHWGGLVSLAGGATQLSSAGALQLGSLGTQDLAVSAVGDIDLGAGSVNGALSASTQGARIVQTGALTITGPSSFVANGGVVSLVLDQAGNQLHGVVSTGSLGGGSFGSVNVVNAADLGFSGDAQTLALSTPGALTLGGGRSTAVTATASTGISQSGALDVSGLMTLVARGAAVPVTLPNAGNDLTRVQLTTQPGGAFAGVQLRDGDASRHDGLQIMGDAAALDITSAGALDLHGGSYGTSLVADTSATGAAITQSGPLAVGGLATFRAGAGSVTLTRSDNSLPNLGIGSAGIASVASVGDISVGASAVSTRLDLASPGAITLAGPLSGAGELVVSGTGSLTITSAQGYGGGTRIQSGTLVLQGPAAQPGSAVVQLGAAGQLDLRDGAVMGNALIAQGGNVLNSSGSATLAGPVTLQASTQFLPSASAGGLTVSGAIGDAGGGWGLRLNGAGTLTLTGSNQFSGATDIAAGTLRAAAANALPSTSDVLLAGGATLALGQDQTLKSLNGAGSIDLGGFTLGLGAGGQDASFSGNISGSGGLTKLGAGSLTLSGSNSHSGATQVAAGQLILASATALNGSTAVTVDAGATLAVQQSLGLGSLAGSGQVVVQAPLLSVGANGGSTVFDGVLSGSGGLAKLGSGRMTLAGHSTLGGDVQLGAGSLQLAVPGALPGGTAVAVAGGATLELLADASLGALTGAGQVQLNANTLTLGATGRDGRFDGVVSGNGNLTKAGSGTLTLGGANLYTGTTDVAAGTLNLAAAQALAGASSLVIDAGGSVQVSAAQAVAALAGSGGLALNGATLAVGAGGADSRFDGVVSGTGGLTKQGAGTLTLTATATNSGASFIEAGTVTLTGAGSLGSGDIQNQGTLALNRSDAFTLGQAVTGSGSLVVQQGQVTLANGGNSYSGATQVLGGSLVTTAAERLPDASAVQVAAGAQLKLGGTETIASLQAAGSVHLAGDLTTKGDQIYTGSLTLANPTGITLSGATVDASKSTNQFNGTPLSLVATQALVTVKEGLQLGNVTLSNGGHIEADRLDLNGKLQLTGGSLGLVANAAPDDAKAAPQGVAQVPLAGVSLALAEATVQQGSGGAITVADGAKLAVQAAGGGSVVLGQDANSFKGQLSVLSGARYDTAWVPNVKGSLGVQSLVRVAGQQVLVGGTGIEADVVSIRADQLATADGAKLVARLPFDETLLGKSLSLPSMTLELTPAAFGLSGNFGAIGGVPIQVEVGSTKTGARSSGPNAGYLTVLPKGGAKGATVIVLAGPEIGSGTVAPYRFFHDGARQATEIPVVYNGVLPLTPSASGALSSINGDAEDARRARFQETVRTENVTVRLRSGVIAEVGPGRASTQGSEGATPPVQCDPAAQPVLSCK